MGYEIKVTYAASGDKAASTKTIKVGKADDDVPIEHLATRVMGILANRSKVVESIELAEFRRKSITFRDDDEGIWIGNKKFRFDAPPIVAPLESESVPEDLVEAVVRAMAEKGLQPHQQPSIQPHQLQPHQLQPHQLLQSQAAAGAPPAAPPTAPPRPVNGVTQTRMRQVYQPNGDYHIIVKQQNVNLKIGKIYDVTATKPNPRGGSLFFLVDDSGRQVWVDSIHFDSPNSANVGVTDDNDDLLNHGNSGLIDNLVLR